MRTVGLFRHLHFQRITLTAQVVELVAHLLKIALGVEPVHQLTHHLGVVRLVQHTRKKVLHIRRRHRALPLHAHLGNAHLALVESWHRALGRHAACGRHPLRQPFKPHTLRRNGRLAARNHLGRTPKLGKPHIAQGRAHQHIRRPQQRQVAPFVLANQQGDHVVGHRQRVAWLRVLGALIRPQKRRHHHIGAFLQRHLHRQIGHQPAVHIHLAVDLHRRKHPRRGHAGANRQIQPTLVKHLGGAVAVAGGHRAEWNLELVKRHRRRHMGQQLLQQRQKTLAIAHASRERQTTVLDAKLKFNRVLLLVLAGAVGQLQAVELVQRHLGRVQAANHFLDLPRVQPGGVQPTNDRAHAGAHNARNRHLVFFQLTQHRQVRKPLGSATGQHHHHLGRGRALRPRRQSHQRPHTHQQTNQCHRSPFASDNANPVPPRHRRKRQAQSSFSITRPPHTWKQER